MTRVPFIRPLREPDPAEKRNHNVAVLQRIRTLLEEKSIFEGTRWRFRADFDAGAILLDSKEVFVITGSEMGRHGAYSLSIVGEGGLNEGQELLISGEYFLQAFAQEQIIPVNKEEYGPSDVGINET
jgi:hypothetical protein